MKHFLLFYDLVPEYLDRRGAFRDEHLALAKNAMARGDLVLAGAFASPADGAALLFQGDSPAAAETFANHDPYVKNGLVRQWQVREWTTVVGKEAANPL